jgi:hypothetical protein
MKKATTTKDVPSTIAWDHLEEFARQKVQEFIQHMLEDEITELLGRRRSERRSVVAEKRFRRLDAAERLIDVYEGRAFSDGKMIQKAGMKAAA